MSKHYELDFNTLVVQLLPTMLRKAKMITWLRVLIAPIISLKERMLLHRQKSIYKLNHNGQVCYLRKALNDAFDPYQRRIKLTDGNRYTAQYIYTDAEEKPSYLGTKYLRDNSVYEDTGADFKVLLPADVWDEYKTEIAIGIYRFYDIEAVINFYKLASKRYKIALL